MGATAQGRYALVTNFREPGKVLDPAPSRGALVEDFLRGDDTPAAYLARVHEAGQAYNGFNLIVGDTREAWYLKPRRRAARAFAPGVYALSNHLLDTPWPKLAPHQGRLHGRPACRPAARPAHAHGRPGRPSARRRRRPARHRPAADRERLLSSPSSSVRTMAPAAPACWRCATAAPDSWMKAPAPDGSISGESRLTFSWRAAGGGDPLPRAAETIG